MTTSANPEKIGRYQILEKVGRGGMGVLLRGVDPVLDREVAIKLMLVDFSEDAEQMRPRFYREARAAARLQHPNIVTVFEFAEEGNTPYIVMEFLRGTSLQARMTSPLPLTVDEKLNIIAQLCSALNYAHEQGVVHRDIKPANIFLLPDGSVKLLDFGVAKLATSTMTRQGDVLGSAMYMSPEQVSGADSVDGRSDIFSTAIVLYEMLANRKPFQAETLTATVVKILREEPPPLEEFVPGLPAQLLGAVKKALAKEPKDRFQTAGEFGKELQWIRQAIQASSQGAGALEETKFASPTQILEIQKEFGKAPAEAPPAFEDETRFVPSSREEAPSKPKWMIPAAVAGVVAIAGVAGFMMFGRGQPAPPADVPVSAAAATSAPTAATASTPTATPGSAPAPAAAVESKLQIETTPAGAAIVLDGKPIDEVTPTSIVVSGGGPHTLRLSKTGFVAQEVKIADADLTTGTVSYKLAPAEVVTVAVSIESTYPVAVISGSQTISPASESHKLKVPSGSTLRVSASQYLLDAALKVAGKPIEYRTPGLGSLTVLTRNETCNVKVGPKVVGFPPITRLPLAAGQYRVDIVCPNGQNPPGQLVTITANETTTARIF